MLKTEVDELISRLGASEKAALRILVDLPAKELDGATQKLFNSYPWTGVILFPKNVEDAGQVRNLIRDLQGVNARRFPDYPLLIAVDQEGGSVSPLEGLVTPSPGNMALGAVGDEEKVYCLSRLAGKELRDLGFNVNFSPVLDVNINPENPIIGIRSFGDNPEKVGKFGVEVISAYQEEGVMATAKHFPGHGDTVADSHLDLPVVNASRDRLSTVELFPFEMAVKAGVWGIMTAHVLFPSLDDRPATLSKKILTGILRNRMKFEGIVFTDSFSMAAIREHYDLEEAVLGSVIAGSDVLLALGEGDIQLEVFQILKRLIEKKKIPQECIDEPLGRILAFRKKLGKFRSPYPFRFPENFVRELHEKSVTIVRGENPPSLSKNPEIFLSPEATPHLEIFKKYFQKSSFVPWPWPANHQKSRNPCWLFLAERRLFSPDAEAALTAWDRPVECCAAFGNPYLLNKVPKAACQITTYHFNELFVQAVCRALVDRKQASGKLPVKTLGK